MCCCGLLRIVDNKKESEKRIKLTLRFSARHCSSVVPSLCVRQNGRLCDCGSWVETIWELV